MLSKSRHWELDLPFTIAAGKIESDAGRLTGDARNEALAAAEATGGVGMPP